MGKRERYRDHLDPEIQRWGRNYPRFPGVAECTRLIRAGKARGTWADMIVHELSENAADHLPEMIAAFRESNDEDVALYVIMALEIAKLPTSIKFLSEVMRERNSRFVPYAHRALVAIDTRESRKTLFDALHAEQIVESECSAESNRNPRHTPRSS